MYRKSDVGDPIRGNLNYATDSIISPRKKKQAIRCDWPNARSISQTPHARGKKKISERKRRKVYYPSRNVERFALYFWHSRMTEKARARLSKKKTKNEKST